MPIQLDKILADIAQEKVLHPNYQPAGKKEVDDAWARVGKNNKLSVHEARSIFKVLQKKYEQEKTKRTPSWKLFDLMEQIHQPIKEEETKPEDDGMVSMEEDEEYEMLEVQEEEEPNTAQTKPTAAATSDGESSEKSMKSTGSADATPEKEEKPIQKSTVKILASSTATSGAATATSSTVKILASSTATSGAATATSSTSPAAAEQKKLLNSLATTRSAVSTTSNSATAAATKAATAAAAAALHKKGITMKKTSSTSSAAGSATNVTPRAAQPAASNANATQQKYGKRLGGTALALGVGDSIPLPESIKRKLVETQPGTPPSKKPNTQSTTTASTTGLGTASAVSASTSVNTKLQENITLPASSANIKQEPADDNGINLITIPSSSRVELTNGEIVGGGATSSTAATQASSTNGFSPRLEEIDFRNDIIFDAGNGPMINGTVTGVVNHANASSAPGGIINLGNFDNSLPPTFFKNLCNSSRHEALGLYVANVMNRLRPRSAAKLELGILRAIIDIQSDEIEQ